MSEYDHHVCVLLFGDHTDLAQRCLNSIKNHFEFGRVTRLCIVLNDVARSTEMVVDDFISRVEADASFSGVELLVCEVKEQGIAKYPIMRRMLYDPEFAIDCKLFTWFDDDSLLVANDVFSKTSSIFRADPRVAVLGASKSYLLRLGQDAWIRRQPWYREKTVMAGTRQSFIAGGWWVADVDFLKSIDYPFPELNHRGGDVLLGAAVRQQDMKRYHFEDGVLVNAHKDSKKSHVAERRGFHSERPLGEGYPDNPVIMPDSSFSIGVRHRLIVPAG